ncbi:unnamed protein product, partial [Staurois parvus]
MTRDYRHSTGDDQRLQIVQEMNRVLLAMHRCTAVCGGKD